MKTYQYTAIQLIDGEIKAVVNKEAKPNIFIDNTFKIHIYTEWQQKHEVFEFANEDETDKVTKHLVNKGTPNNYNLLYNGIQVTCIEIKDGKAYFKSEDKSQEDEQDWLLTKLIGMYNAEYTSEEILTKFKITKI